VKISYNRAIDPAAPYLSILVTNPYQLILQNTLEAKLDTGADVTALPAISISNLALSQANWLEVSGFASESEFVPTYEARVEVAGQAIHLEVVAYSENYALLGRDFLNHLRLLLDGPAQTLEALK